MKRCVQAAFFAACALFVSRARQAINAGDEQRVAFAEGIDGPAQLRPVSACAALLFGVQLVRARALKFVDLSVERLTVGRNPSRRTEAAGMRRSEVVDND